MQLHLYKQSLCWGSDSYQFKYKYAETFNYNKKKIKKSINIHNNL